MAEGVSSGVAPGNDACSALVLPAEFRYDGKVVETRAFLPDLILIARASRGI